MELFLGSYEDILKNIQSERCSIRIKSLKELNKYISQTDIRAYSVSHCYCSLLKVILSNLKLETSELWKEEEKEIEIFILKTYHPDSWLLLNNFMKTTEPSFKLNKITELLELFIKSESLLILFVRIEKYDKEIQDEFIQSVVSFPERSANKLKKENPEPFFPKEFYTRVADAILYTLHNLYKLLKCDQNASTIFVSKFVGKLGMTGNLDLILSIITPKLISLMDKDFLWRRIIQKFIKNIPNRCLETFLTSLFCYIPWYGFVSYFLNDMILDNTKLQHLLTKRFFLFKLLEKDLISQNIVGYLAESKSRHKYFFQAFLLILEVWGDRSSIRHISFNHHLFLTKVIAIFLGFLRKLKIDVQELKNDIMNSIIHGTQSHIENPEESIRNIGMFISKYSCEIVDPKGPKLEYEVPDKAELNLLKSLLEIPLRPNPQVAEDDEEILSLEMKRLSHNEVTSSNKNLGDEAYSNDENKCSKVDSDEDTDLDSDDDLQPYEIPSETRKDLKAKPVYIRDCIEGLNMKEKPEWTEKCLECLESIIRTRPDNIHELAQEISRVLLHLDDVYNLPKFSSLRHKSLVAILVVSPAKAVEYLTSQFYERDYNIRQRLDILESIVAASQELSSNVDKSAIKQTLDHANVVKTYDPTNWRQIVDDRIKEKTRIISKGRTKKKEEPSKNNFFEVAGLFFFPLIKYIDKKNNYLDLFGEDNFVLGRLIYSLAMIINSAANSMICHSMAAEMLDIIWVLRYHSEKYVRQALIFSFTIILISVEDHILLDEFQTQLHECSLWLKDIIEEDSDEECQKFSHQAMSILLNKVKKEFQS